MNSILPNGPDLLVLEFKSCSVGYDATNSIFNYDVRVLEAFPTLPGNFVILVNGTTSELNKILKKFKPKNSCLLHNVSEQTLKGFYNLLKNSPEESLWVGDFNSFSKLISAADLAAQSNLKIVEIRSERSFLKNLLLVTGSQINIKNFNKKITKKNGLTQSKSIEKLNTTFTELFGFP